MRTLGRIAPAEAAKVVPALVGRLDDDSEDIRGTALIALARFGPAARPAADALAKAVNRGSPDLRVRAIQALAAVKPDPASTVPALASALTAGEATVRLAAARALGQVGPNGPAVEALRKSLDDTDPEVRQAAADALLNRP